MSAEAVRPADARAAFAGVRGERLTHRFGRRLTGIRGLEFEFEGPGAGAFSSGMKQRLRLAFALLHRPPILMLDEPGSHLDDAGREVVRAVVARQAARGLVLIATNDAQEVQLAAARLELRASGLGNPA